MSDDIAPWEQGSAKASARKSDRKSVTPDGDYKLPSDDKLPEVLKPDTGGIVAGGDITVPRPPISTPREPQPSAKTAMMALLGGAALGVVLIVVGFVVFSADLNVLRMGLAGLGGLLALACLAVYVIESGRLGQYRTRTFFPAVLCYGSTQSFTKYAGPAGVAGINATRIRGSGKGLLSIVFDKSAHAAGAPEVVALLLDRGAGPELVGVDWEAVRQCQRGDIVWYHAIAPKDFIFFHLMVPFAPAIATDRATKEEVFRALKVGKSMFKDFPKKEVAGAAMGKNTKVIKTDASGNIVAAQNDSGEGREFVEAEAEEQGPELKLSELGGALGAAQDEQYPPGEESNDEPPPPPVKPGSGRRPKYDALSGATEYSPPPKDIGKFRIADPSKPLGGYGNQDQSGET
ncbi:hypothetical protein PLCT2_02707 [Planctomycetaceae bacterium]|nr:hypothetical protein PLCT2_02707 [Planctomycetaceae bacterium]